MRFKKVNSFFWIPDRGRFAPLSGMTSFNMVYAYKKFLISLQLN